MLKSLFSRFLSQTGRKVAAKHKFVEGHFIARSISTTRFPASAAGPSSFLSPSESINGTMLPRTAISLLGAVNAGKSVLMNLLTQSNVSIVHETAGTTADPKGCLMELHGRIGPVRLVDTPGVDENGELGKLKRERSLETIGQSDVVFIVADPFADHSARCVAEILLKVYERQSMNRQAEDAIKSAKKRGGTILKVTGESPTPIPLILFNLRQDKVKELESKGGSVSLMLSNLEKKIVDEVAAMCQKAGSKIKHPIPPSLALDFTALSPSRDRVINFLECHTDPRPASVNLLPDFIKDTHLEGHSPTVFLNIPMDQETPAFRLLRPQAMVQEALIRNFVSTHAFRMDLKLARSANSVERQREKDRFLKALDPFLSVGELALLITDSQAIDVVGPWTMSSVGQEIVPITTFSIALIRYMSGGRLEYFTDGLRRLDQMVTRKVSPVDGVGGKWRILIAEACTHTKLNEEKQCADIGTVQLPNHLKSVLGKENVDFEFAFGKHAIFDPTRFDLVVHCGGCMLSPQQMNARVADLCSFGIPATNYGLLLSRVQSPTTLSRVLKPWGIIYEHAANKPECAATL